MSPADPLELVLSFLNTQPELALVPVAADLTGHATNGPHVLVQLSGGFRVVRDRLDRADFAVHVYGPSKREATSLAFVVRELLLRRLPGHIAGPVTVTDVREGSSPQDFPDPESSVIPAISHHLLSSRTRNPECVTAPDTTPAIGHLR